MHIHKLQGTGNTCQIATKIIKILPIMLALFSMLLLTYKAQKNASLIILTRSPGTFLRKNVRAEGCEEKSVRDNFVEQWF